MGTVGKGTVLGGYTLEDKIGEGGFATVFAARGPSGEIVAVKVLHPVQARQGEALEETDRRQNEVNGRFTIETRALRSIQSSHVVRGIAHGQEADGTRYLVMEIVPGYSLSHILDTEGLRPETALDYARYILLGLVAAHARSIVHRDVKPDNVIIGSSGQVKIIDFGAAQINGPNGLTNSHEAIATGNKVVLGTPDYMSPEQARGETVTGACDVFAVGALLFEMLTGRPLLVGYEVGNLYRALRRGEGADVAELLNDERIRSLLPRAQEMFPESEEIPQSSTIALALLGEENYSIDAKLTAPYGERVHRLLERLTAFRPEDRPTAEEAATELKDIVLHGEYQSSAKAEAEKVTEDPPAPPTKSAEAITARIVPQRSAVLAMLAAGSIFGLVVATLILAFFHRPTVYVVELTTPAPHNRPQQVANVVQATTKPPEIASTSVMGEGCRMVEHHGHPRKVCPRAARPHTSHPHGRHRRHHRH